MAMGNPHHRPKYMQSKSWFLFEHEGRTRVVRPVDGEEHYGQPGVTHGVIHLIDENHDLVTVCSLDYFEKNASRSR